MQGKKLKAEISVLESSINETRKIIQASRSYQYLPTKIIQVRDCDVDMNLPSLKLWLTGALLNHGFEF
ncbi:hypothetical protein SDJN02_02780, partial [Cucurbita argyrosperma subsp. argyrosperma]